MATVDNWIDVIKWDLEDEAILDEVEIDWVIQLIKKHCPFKEGVAYEEVRVVISHD